MKPPICTLCDCRLAPDDGGGLVHFHLTEAQKAANKAFEQPGFVGHPQGLHWFCGEHIGKAKEMAHCTDNEALALMKIHFGMAVPHPQAGSRLLQAMRN